MVRRFPYLLLSFGALLLAACSQTTALSSPSTAVQAVSSTTYTIDAENASLLDGVLYGVRVGQGLSGPAHDGRVSVGGKRVISGKFRNGQSAKVLELWGGNRIGVVNNAKSNTLNRGGGQLQFVFTPYFSKKLVTVKELTIYNVVKPGVTVNLYQGRKLVKKVPVPIGAAGEPVKVTIDEPGVTILSVTTRFPIAVDDLVFEVPSEQESFVGQELLGAWEGEVFQPGYGSWSVSLNVAKDTVSNQVAGEVAYPSLNCGGSWTLKGAEDNKFNFTEQITYGTNNCVVTSDVSVTYNQDGSLSYDWQYYGSSATGTLYRAKPK